MKKKSLFKKIIATIFLLIISFVNFNTVSFAQNSQDVAGQAVQSIEGLSDPKRGLMPCDPYSENKDEQCTPKDAVTLVKKLGQVALYIIIIALFVMLVIGGLGYIYYGKSPQYLNKWKKYIKNSVVAILLIVGVIGLVLGILAAVGFDQQVLGFLKQILAQTDFSFFNHAYAQEIPAPAPGPEGEYTNFFPRETVGSLILKIIKVIINYIVAPALVLSTIWAGFLFVKAEGNPQKLTEAKKFAVRVVVGIVVAAAAATIVNVILNSLNEVTNKVNSEIGTTQSE
ncbi:hypothetical protein SDC9_33261 [bioreactor metagenome]|uniref:Uncharacterized protein n=1 Tax=bioreactor metagenome TaxID=1076179 RepID=A0A644V7S6_9ZZZZ|nr:pilin [Candidatus Elulimicrobiales bacterium]